MPQIIINLDSDENKKIEIFKAKHGLKNKADAIKLVIKSFFNLKNKKR